MPTFNKVNLEKREAGDKAVKNSGNGEERTIPVDNVGSWAFAYDDTMETNVSDIENVSVPDLNDGLESSEEEGEGVLRTESDADKTLTCNGANNVFAYFEKEEKTDAAQTALEVEEIFHLDETIGKYVDKLVRESIQGNKYVSKKYFLITVNVEKWLKERQTASNSGATPEIGDAEKSMKVHESSIREAGNEKSAEKERVSLGRNATNKTDIKFKAGNANELNQKDTSHLIGDVIGLPQIPENKNESIGRDLDIATIENVEIEHDVSMRRIGPRLRVKKFYAKVPRRLFLDGQKEKSKGFVANEIVVEIKDDGNEPMGSSSENQCTDEMMTEEEKKTESMLPSNCRSHNRSFREREVFTKYSWIHLSEGHQSRSTN